MPTSAVDRARARWQEEYADTPVSVITLGADTPQRGVMKI